MRDTALARLNVMMLTAVDEKCGMFWIKSRVFPFPLTFQEERESVGPSAVLAKASICKHYTTPKGCTAACKLVELSTAGMQMHRS